VAKRPVQHVLSDVGRRIAELRARRGWTQDVLAERLEVSAKYVQSVERGQENLTLETLAGIAAELGVSLSMLTRRPVTERRVGRPAKDARTLPFEEVEPAPQDLYRRCVPLVTLEARAGVRDEARSVETTAWVIPATRRRLGPGMFVAPVVGRSMEPRIPSGAWALFRAVTQPPPAGAVVLAQHRDADDPGDAGAYLLKRLDVTKRHSRLVSDAPGFEPVVLKPDDDSWRIVAVLVEVLGTSAPID